MSEHINQLTRKEIEKRWLHASASVLTKEQHNIFSDKITAMPDCEFFQLVAEAVCSVDGENSSLKEFAELTKKMQNINGVTSENSALNNFGIHFLNDAENTELIKKVNETSPTDIIKISSNQDEELIDLWERGSRENVYIPSDLFWNETLPLLDCEIEVDERERFFEKQNMFGRLITYRVVIFEDFMQKVRNAKDNEVLEVGALILNIPNGTGSLVVPLKIARGLDCIPIPPKLGFINTNYNQKKLLQKKLSQADIGKMIVSYLETWYGIQIALLHPTVKEIFRKSTKIPITGKKKIRNTNHNKKLKYIKCHVIDDVELKKAIYGNSKNINRTALIWHVIGHWRTSKSGKKVFIKPYWKGALRDNKKLQEAREREVEINKSEENHQSKKAD